MSGAGISPSVTQPARSDRPDRYLSGIDAYVSSAMRASYPPLVLTQRDAPQTWNQPPQTSLWPKAYSLEGAEGALCEVRPNGVLGSWREGAAPSLRRTASAWPGSTTVFPPRPG